MPYCCQCGSEVRPVDRFCGVCGTQQATPGTGAAPGGAPRSVPHPDILSGLTSRNAALLCYIPVVGWIASVVVLASTRFRRDTEVRFHAFQGLYLFVAWLIVNQVIAPVFGWPGGWGIRHLFTQLMNAGMIALWIFMMVKVSQGQTYRLPILGELADRSVSEQR